MAKKPPSLPDDANLWTLVSESVEPLKGRHKRLADEAHLDIEAPAPEKNVTPVPRPRPTPSPIAPPPPPTLPELTVDSQPGLDKASANRFKRGKVDIEARLDLHGMIQDQAHRALEAFIEAAFHAGRRTVIVVTGKGTKPDGSIGVLRQSVPRWLNQAPNRGRVIAFSQAAPKDGGEGALYIRIKKKR